MQLVRSSFLALVPALLAILPGVASADIFQYTDADGVVHFTNSKPSDARAKVYMRGIDGPAVKKPSGGVPPGSFTQFAPQDRDVARFTRYDDWIREAATLYQIPEQLVRAVIKVESDYDPRAVSYAGARGLMQLMPDTADRLQVRDINDPRENIFGGVRYLRILANSFNGDLALTVAGYNAGEDAVMRYGGIPPYAQTRDYVVKVTSYYRRYRTIPDVVDASLATNAGPTP
ncbi:MAG: Lytic transglycosylase, catalytic [Myxococcaceae bacterium]|nr:Lytic transglycosylase, catalytic [Myxococcaceae bacterium]